MEMSFSAGGYPQVGARSKIFDFAFSKDSTLRYRVVIFERRGRGGARHGLAAYSLVTVQ